MSRFNNPKMLPALPKKQIQDLEKNSAPESRSYAIAAPTAKREFSARSEVQPNLAQSLCFFAICAYLLSGYANDFAYHFGHNKVYVSMVALVLMPIFFLLSGSALLGWKVASGKWWLAFVAWVALAIPFSVWRGGSAAMFINYVPRNYLLFFFIAASAINLPQCRRLMYVLGVGGFLVLLSCFVFGASENGRFSINQSLFFSNPNELGLQLALNIMIFTFPFFGKNPFAKIAGAVGIAVSAVYMLKTGSRGVLIALLGAGAVAFLLSRHKMRIVAVVVPLFVAVLATIPSDTRHRLGFIFGEPEKVQLNTLEEASALDSQLEREQLLKTSIVNAMTHPVFGVGPNEFAVAVAGEAEKSGKHSNWLGTHNTYTQVASEAGLPAFVFYVATLLTCLRGNYRLYRRAARQELQDVAGLTYCLLLCCVVYAISTFFFHIAYSYYLPLIAGLSAATHLSSQPVLRTASLGSPVSPVAA